MRRRYARRWLRVVLVLLAGLIAGSFGLSLALRDGWARRGLLARLAAGFGRPVEVGHFEFSLLSGLRLEAQSVTVYDDPRFGQEYFLRADRLTASVRWSALVRGRFEFETVSLTRPSLNLVRLSDGQWNIESWLPPLPAADGAAGTAAAAGASVALSPAARAITARLSRIEVDGGRINFKRDSRKLPLALVAVNGRFDQDGAGHWNIDVQANPMRAPASLQQVGTLRVRGVMGGVSTRLRPASLGLTWEDASLADLSRLVQGRDYGLRGTLGAEFTARIEDSPSLEPSGAEWSIEGTLRLQGVHGWSLAGRAGDPNANVSIQAKWRPAEYRLLVTRCLIEAPQSSLSATSNMDWSHGFQPEVEFTSSRVSLADLLAWRRALRPGVADDLAVEGTVDAEGTLSGWPLRVKDLDLASAGALIRSPDLPGPIRVGPIVTDWSGDTLKLRPMPVFLPVAAGAVLAARNNGATLDSSPSSSALLVEGAVGPLPSMNELPDARYRLAVSGAARRSQDLLALLRAWGSSTGSSWTAEGPVTLQLALTGSLRSGTSAAIGTIQARGAQFTSALMNRPFVITSASVELRGDQRRINLDSVQAVGARWKGSVHGPAENGAWDFDLSADHLDVADFYTWLGPPARPNLLQRMLPFGAAASDGSAGRADALENLQARGRLRVGELMFAPLQVAKIDGAAVIDGSSLSLRQGRAELLGGQLTGDFEARLSADPEYSFDGKLTRVDLRDFTEMASLPGRVNGLASGELKLTAHGPDRISLAASLQGQGLLRVPEGSLGEIEFAPAAATAVPDPVLNWDSRPFAVTTRFTIGAARINFDQLLLARPGEQTEVSGTVDFARRLDLRIQSVPFPRPAATDVGIVAQGDSWTIGGTLDAPRIISAPAANTRTGVPLASR